MFVTLFIFVLVQGLVSSKEEIENDPQSCFEITESPGRPNFTDVIPNSEEILRECPVVEEYIDCLIRTVSETGLYFEIDDLLSARSFLDDMCDETSRLHQDYVNNFDCFKSMADKWDGCKAVASGMIEEFRKSSYEYAFQRTDLEDLNEEQLEELKVDRAFAEAHCLLDAHTFGCIGMKIQEKCGHGAYQTYVEILTRDQMAKGFCDIKDVKPFLKGYLVYLSKENKAKEADIIRDILNVETD